MERTDKSTCIVQASEMRFPHSAVRMRTRHIMINEITKDEVGMEPLIKMLEKYRL